MSAFLDQWDLQLLKCFAEDIATASRTNPRSWALKVTENSITLTVHQWNVLKMGARTCECWLPGDPSDSRFEYPYATADQIEYRPSKEGFWVRKLSHRDLRTLLDIRYDQHQADIPRIAKQVTTKCRDWDKHDQQVQDDLAELTGMDLPRPGYLR